MLRLPFAFLILLGAVAVGVQINKDPGYVLIAINHWTFETTVWVAIFGLLILFLLLHFIMRVAKNIVHAPAALTQWNRKRRAQKAQTITRKGLIEYSEGYWLRAKNHLIQALPNTDTPLLNYLTAARAAQKMGDSQLRDNYLREAQQLMPEAKIAVELTQAELQLANHQWEQALATLKHLQDIAPHHPYVLKLMMQLYQEVEDWPQLIILLPQLNKYAVVNQQEFKLLQYHAYLQQLIALIKQNQLTIVNAFYHTLPKNLATEPNILAEYARFLLKNSQFIIAHNLLRKALRKEYSPQLVILYDLLPADEKMLSFVESLLKNNSHSAILYTCLGKMCIKQKLWGKAKHYLEKANQIEPTPLNYQIQGQFHEILGEETLACQSYKQGLELLTKDNI